MADSVRRHRRSAQGPLAPYPAPLSSRPPSGPQTVKHLPRPPTPDAPLTFMTPDQRSIWRISHFTSNLFLSSAFGTKVS